VKVFLSQVDGGVQILARLEGDGVFSCFSQIVPAGGKFLGYSHDELVAMGAGEHDLTGARRRPRAIGKTVR
jgi:hypothetical protein